MWYKPPSYWNDVVQTSLLLKWCGTNLPLIEMMQYKPPSYWNDVVQTSLLLKWCGTNLPLIEMIWYKPPSYWNDVVQTSLLLKWCGTNLPLIEMMWYKPTSYWNDAVQTSLLLKWWGHINVLNIWVKCQTLTYNWLSSVVVKNAQIFNFIHTCIFNLREADVMFNIAPLKRSDGTKYHVSIVKPASTDTSV
jgi:hypothetical protein